MKLKLWAAAIGALLVVPLFALAQQPPRPADPADPNAAVPPAVYEPAFTRAAPRAPEQADVTPDKVWRAANDTVAGTSSHVGHGAAAAENDGAHARHAPAAHAAPAPSAKPASQPAADHSKHH